jgi:hypothetical protein
VSITIHFDAGREIAIRVYSDEIASQKAGAILYHECRRMQISPAQQQELYLLCKQTWDYLKNHVRHESRQQMLARYQANTSIPTGHDIPCAACGEIIRKKQTRHQFCCSICKSTFWNAVKLLPPDL